MSTPTTRDPLVVNTQDGAVWMRRAVTREGRGLYAVADAPKCCPEYVMATLAELTEHGITGSAYALPMPVGPVVRSELDRARDDVVGACLARWEEEQENARLRLALKSAKRRALRRLPHEREGLIFRLEQDNKQLHAFVKIANEAAHVQREAWEGAQDELERLGARVAELEAERHTTNEALDDAVQALRTNRDRIAELERQIAAEECRCPEPAPLCEGCRCKCHAGQASADKLTAPLAPSDEREAARRSVDRAFPAVAEFLTDGVTRLNVPLQALREDSHDGPLSHRYQLGRDLPETGGAQ